MKNAWVLYVMAALAGVASGTTPGGVSGEDERRSKMKKAWVLYVMAALAGVAVGSLWAFYLLGGVK